MTDTNTKKTPKITEYDTFSTSPFTVEISSKLVAAKPDHQVIEDKATGKIYGMYEIPKNKSVPHDKASYTKLFHGNGKFLMTMPEPSYRLFTYIHDNLKANSDTICIPMEVFLEYAGYKETNRPTYYRAIEGLLKLTVLARVTGSPFCYYINPNILFNGDRTKLNNIKVKSFDDGSLNNSESNFE